MSALSPAYRDRVRERLAGRIRMVPPAVAPGAPPAPTTIEERIEEEARERHAGLLRRARLQRIDGRPDPGPPGQYITWSRVTFRPRPLTSAEFNGRANLTTTASCTCREFRVWHRCPCVALVREIEARGEERAA